MRTALGHVEILARDLAAAERFYVGGLGFEVTERQGPSAVWLRAGRGVVLLRQGADGVREATGPRATSYAACGTALVVYTDDVAAVLARLAALHFPVCGDDGGPACPLVRDPDGNWLQVVDPRAHGGTWDADEA